MDFFDEINNLEYLFLLDVKDLPGNKLLIVVKEAIISQQEEDLYIGDKNLGPVRGISKDGQGKEYELFFESYGAYCIVNESFATFNNDDEQRIGRLLCVFSKSKFMDYIRETTIVDYTYDYNKTLKHYAVSCLGHVIDIVSKEEPIVKKRIVKLA